MWSDTFSLPSRAPTRPNLRVVIKNRNVSRIGCWNDRILDQLMCKIAACAVSKRLMNMQHNNGNRKSNRIHQPKAQDSKTCPTFPDIWGEVVTPFLEHTVTGLPLQIYHFNFLCVLIEKPAHTSDRYQWAPCQGTGTQSYLPHFKMLSLRLVGIAWTQPTVTVELEGQGQGQARASLASSVSTAHTESNQPTFKSRAISESRRRQPAHITRQGLSQCGDGLSWDVHPGPSCGHHGRRRRRSGTGAVDLSSRAR